MGWWVGGGVYLDYHKKKCNVLFFLDLNVAKISFPIHCISNSDSIFNGVWVGGVKHLFGIGFFIITKPVTGGRINSQSP